MNDATRRQLQQQLRTARATALTYRQGVVTAIAPLAVDLGGSGSPVAASALQSYSPRVGDVVACAMFGNDMLVLGCVAASAGTADFTAVSTIDIPITAADRLVTIDYAVEASTLAELRMAPNALGTAIYGDIRDGSFETSTPAAAPVAAQGAGTLHNNGLRLSFAPQGAGSGGVTLSGRATFQVAVPTVPNAVRRACMAQTAVSSTTGAANHLIELQNIASVMQSAVPITSLRFAVNAGTMTGTISVRSL